MANTAGMQSALGKAGVNIGGTQAIALQSVDLATLKALKDPKEAAAFFKDKGINIDESNAGKALDVITREKQIQMLRPVVTSMGLNAGEITDKMRAGTLSREEQMAINNGSVLAGYSGGKQFGLTFNGVTAPNAAPGSAKPSADPNDVKNQADFLSTSGFKQLSEAALSASTGLGGFTKALGEFMNLQKGFEVGGANNEDEYAGSAAKLSKDFATVAVKFNTAGSNMVTASLNMLEAARLKSNGLALVPNFATDMLNQKKGDGNH
jgi:hypothetical protein